MIEEGSNREKDVEYPLELCASSTLISDWKASILLDCSADYMVPTHHIRPDQSLPHTSYKYMSYKNNESSATP